MILSKSGLFFAPFALLGIVSLTACGGGSSGTSSSSVTPSVPTNPVTSTSAKAHQTFAIRIPMGVSISKIPVNTASPAAKARAAAALRKPLYVSPDTANFKLYLDAKTTIATPAIALTVPDVAGTTASQAPLTGSVTLTSGQTIAYTASVATANDVT